MPTSGSRSSIRQGSRWRRMLSLPVRPAAMPVTTRTVVSLAPGGGSLKVDGGLLAASLLDGATVSVGVSPSAALDVPSLLLALDRYPYGCAEQTTSRALPLLYVAELAKSAGMADDPALRERIQQAIDTRAHLPVLVGQLRPLVPRLGRSVARRLCQRFPDPRPRAGLRRAGRRPCARRSTICRTRWPTTSTSRTAAARSPMRSTCWPATRRPRSATCATTPTRKLEAFRSPMARAQLAAALALYGDAPARRRRPSASALTLAQRQRGDDRLSAPTTARRCATAPPCWRLPPRPRPRRRRCRRWSATSPKRAARQP